MKTLKKIGLTLLIIFLAYFVAAIFTSPTGVAAAISDPWNAIQLLTFRIAGLEERVASLEERMAKIEGGNQQENWQPAPGELDKLHPDENYPYLAQLPSDLQKKMTVRYSWHIEGDALVIEVKARSTSDKPIYDIRVQEIRKDYSGNRILTPEEKQEIEKIGGEMIVGSDGKQYIVGGWGSSLVRPADAKNIPKPEEPIFFGIKRPLPADLLKQLANIDLMVIQVIFMK